MEDADDIHGVMREAEFVALKFVGYVVVPGIVDLLEVGTWHIAQSTVVTQDRH